MLRLSSFARPFAGSERRVANYCDGLSPVVSRGDGPFPIMTRSNKVTWGTRICNIDPENARAVQPRTFKCDSDSKIRIPGTMFPRAKWEVGNRVIWSQPSYLMVATARRPVSGH